MKIFLENLYHSDCYFLPIRDNQQVLVGVEFGKNVLPDEQITKPHSLSS